MMLPYSILKRLPMWEHFCPACHTSLNVKYYPLCLNCGLHIEIPMDKLKAPPRLLKDAKRLSNYVHEKIFPSLSAAEREILARWFTEFFNNGFEEGDFSAWTSTVGTIEVESNNPHHGTYNARAYPNTGTGYAFCKKQDIQRTTLYIRVYAKLTTLPSSGKTLLGFLQARYASAVRFQAGIRNNSGTYEWALNYWVDNDNSAFAYVASTIMTGTWYCIEAAQFYDASTGWAKLWIDGDLKIDITGIDTSANYRPYNFYCGAQMAAIDQEYEVFLDCYIAADAYIGTEEAGPTLIEVADVLGLSDAATRPVRTFSVSDVAGLSDAALRDKTFSVAETLGFVDAVTRGKVFAIADAIGLSDAALLSVALKIIEDASALSDLAALPEKAAIVSDALDLTDEALRDKVFEVLDSIGLTDAADRELAFLGIILIALSLRRRGASISLLRRGVELEVKRMGVELEVVG